MKIVSTLERRIEEKYVHIQLPEILYQCFHSHGKLDLYIIQLTHIAYMQTCINLSKSQS